MHIEMDDLGEVPILRESSEFTINRSGFLNTRYELDFPPALSSRISQAHYVAILETVTRIHDRFPVSPLFAHALAILVVLVIIEITLTTALFTPLVLVVGLLLTLSIPCAYVIIQITRTRDHQIATVSAFLSDANVEFTEVGLHWMYTSPQNPIILHVEEIVAQSDGPYGSFKAQTDLEIEAEENFQRTPWSQLVAKDQCSCVFIDFDELVESKALVSCTIPYSSREQATCRVTLFPSGRLRCTIMIAVMDVKSAWFNLKDLQMLAAKRQSRLSIWEATHIFNADHLLDLLALHLRD